MLTENSRPVIEATLPLVGQNIATIAERFYQHMFGERPELLDGLFNRGNQAEGTQQQALAGSVALFATALVEHPERLPEQLLSRIAHKHASLGVRADQYRVRFASDFAPHFAGLISPHLEACRAHPGASHERLSVQRQRYRPARSARQAVLVAEREVRDLAQPDPWRAHDRAGRRAGRR